MRSTDVASLARLFTGALAIALSLVACRSAPPADGVPAQYRIVGYTTGRQAVQDRDAGKLDTLIFAFARVREDRVVLDGDGTERLRSLVALKARHPGLKVSIAVGGWGAGGFSEAAATAAGRRTFADSAAELVAAHRADGIDVDWEYPGFDDAGIAASPDDRANFTLLVRELRASLDRVGRREGRAGAARYTLSAAVADGPFVAGIDIAAVAPYLDWFNLMTYDFVNAMTPTTGHHTGLYASAQAPADARTGDRAVRQFLAAGVPPRKLLLGAAFYAREFVDVQPQADGLYRSFGEYRGAHPWPQLKADYIDRQGYVRHWDAQAQASWLWNARTRRFITYDDPRSLAAKAAYVEERGLGGIMYWEHGNDDTGELLDAIWQGLR